MYNCLSDIRSKPVRSICSRQRQLVENRYVSFGTPSQTSPKSLGSVGKPEEDELQPKGFVLVKLAAPAPVPVPGRYGTVLHVNKQTGGNDLVHIGFYPFCS